jgi:hypothetical protein
VSDPGPDWRARRGKRVQVAAIAALVYPVAAALGRTYRYVEDGREHLTALEAAGRPFIHAFWHGHILPSAYYFRRRGIVVITSENFDGEWIARVIGRLGYGTARGSSSRGGVRALVQLRRDMAAGRSTAFTVDGPRGPALRVQPGAVWLARATGAPILPFHFEGDRHWTARSWDRTHVPKPRARVAACFAPPQYVPADADEAGLEAARRRLEETLLQLMVRARQMLG